MKLKQTLALLKSHRLFPLLKFLFYFNLFSIFLYLYVFFPIPLRGLEALTANFIAFLLSAVGVKTFVSSNAITLPSSGFTAFIDRECLGIKITLCFLALSWSTPVSLKRKLSSFLFIPFAYLGNALRIFLVFLSVDKFGTGVFPVAHGIFFSLFSLLLVALLWLGWLCLVSDKRNLAYLR